MGRPSALYLDTSAVLRAVLERGTTPEIEEQIGSATTLLTSRISLVESGRALLRARPLARIPEERWNDAEREVGSIWLRTDLWEVTPAICESAAGIAPRANLRSLDAIHLATFAAARSKIPGLTLLTADERLRTAAASA